MNSERLSPQATFHCRWCGYAASSGSLRTVPTGYRVCGRCGSLRARDADHVDYSELYRGHFPEGVRSDSPALEKRYERWLAHWEGRVPVRRILEVGCGNGQLLHVARERGWSAHGVELSQAQVEHCLRRALDVEYGDLVADALFVQGGFGLAVAVEVLEHVPDPTALLQGLHDRLVPGGGVLVTTPNANSVSRKLLGGRWSVLGPEHVTLATPRGLSRAFVHAGFHSARVRSRNVNPTELVSGLKARWVPGAARQPEGASGGPVLSGRERNEAAGRIQERVAGSRLLQATKFLLNGALSLSGSGDTLVGRAFRRGVR